MDVGRDLDISVRRGRSCGGTARARPLTTPALGLSGLDRHPNKCPLVREEPHWKVPSTTSALPYRAPQAERPLSGCDNYESKCRPGDQTARISGKAFQNSAAGNNVGIEDRENILRINDLCLWCARRAVAFAVISIGYRDPLQHKVHFGPKGVFEELLL
jgi:hypothetical protein